jgi:hypothetical protein
VSTIAGGCWTSFGVFHLVKRTAAPEWHMVRRSLDFLAHIG